MLLKGVGGLAEEWAQRGLKCWWSPPSRNFKLFTISPEMATLSTLISWKLLNLLINIFAWKVYICIYFFLLFLDHVLSLLWYFCFFLSIIGVDVMDRLTVLRGKGMPLLYSWSCKRYIKLTRISMKILVSAYDFKLKNTEKRKVA